MRVFYCTVVFEAEGADRGGLSYAAECLRVCRNSDQRRRVVSAPPQIVGVSAQVLTNGEATAEPTLV